METKIIAATVAATAGLILLGYILGRHSAQKPSTDIEKETTAPSVEPSLDSKIDEARAKVFTQIADNIAKQ